MSRRNRTRLTYTTAWATRSSPPATVRARERNSVRRATSPFASTNLPLRKHSRNSTRWTTLPFKPGSRNRPERPRLFGTAISSRGITGREECDDANNHSNQRYRCRARSRLLFQHGRSVDTVSGFGGTERGDHDRGARRLECEG